jgi:hypothetical protein
MIETKRIGAGGVAIDCPHCSKALLTVFARGPKNAFDRFLYAKIPVESMPRPRMLGWDVEVRLGACAFCASDYFGISARFIDALPNDDFIKVYFSRKGDRGQENNFIGQRGNETWIISRFDTPLGPMLEHQFGPFPGFSDARLWQFGVAGSATRGPSDLARHFLLTQWDELRTMPNRLEFAGNRA